LSPPVDCPPCLFSAACRRARISAKDAIVFSPLKVAYVVLPI